MTDELSEESAAAAAKAVTACEVRGGGPLDYSEASLSVVEASLAKAASFTSQMSPDELTNLSQCFGCYILEIGRRAFGGRYYGHEQRNQPVLVIGEPSFHVAILAWDKVRGRVLGDAGDNIPFFYAGFAARVRRATTGSNCLYT